MSNNKSDQVKKSNLRRIIYFAIFIIAIGILIIGKEELQDNLNSNSSNLFGETISNSEYSKPADGELILHMIDVGQADSFLLIQDECTALIDCGTRSTGSDVVKYLNDIGITKIDYVIGTHPHDDHMGGMYDVITNFKIGKIIIPEVEVGKVTSNWYLKLMSEIKSGKYSVENPNIKDIYNLGDATIKVIGPLSVPNDNTNNYSIVLRVTFGEMDIIMTGDAEKDVEAEILASGEDVDAEILKIGHHGSDTSSSEEWLDAITPDYALISTKIGNKYHHPIKSVMKLLEERNIDVYRTDEVGTVIATITSNDVTFNCNPCNYLCGDEMTEENTK